MDYLKDDLINLAKNHPDDVREYLPKIQEEMNKRNLIYNNGQVVQFFNKDINDNEVWVFLFFDVLYIINYV